MLGATSRWYWRRVCAVGLIVIAAGDGSTVVSAQGTGRPAAPAWLTLALPGAANQNPSIATRGAMVAVAWGATATGRPTAVYAAVSRDGGRSFGRAIRVSRDAANVSVSGEQPPLVVLPEGGNGQRVVVAWAEKGARGTELLAARSDDSGASFSEPRLIPGAEGPGNRGWASLAPTPNGDVVAVWLDHRETVTAPMDHAAMGHHAVAGTAPAAKGDGAARAQLSKLYVSALSGTGARVVAAGVCYCCKTGVVASGDDVLAVWRHVYPGNLRDIAFAASRDRGRTFAAPVRVSEDHWMIDGCPENGPTVTVAGAAVHVIWPTVVAGSGAGEPTMALFHAVTTDHRTFCSRNRVPTEGATPKHPRATTLTDGRVAVVWDEGVSGRRQVVLGRKGRRPGDVFDRTVLPDYDFAQYPAVAALPEGGLVVAWASGVAERTVVHVARMGR